MNIIVKHPSPVLLLIGTAKQKWKHSYHVERWEKRYNKKYSKIQGQSGFFSGFII